jgi:hypothetical protein
LVHSSQPSWSRSLGRSFGSSRSQGPLLNSAIISTGAMIEGELALSTEPRASELPSWSSTQVIVER